MLDNSDKVVLLIRRQDEEMYVDLECEDVCRRCVYGHEDDEWEGKKVCVFSFKTKNSRKFQIIDYFGDSTNQLNLRRHVKISRYGCSIPSQRFLPKNHMAPVA